MQAIVVCTTPGREDWLKDCLQSLNGRTNYPVIVLSDSTWELGKIRFILSHTDISEFFLLHDTCVLKEASIFERAFNHPHGYAMADNFQMYLGKYVADKAALCPIPVISSKAEAVKQEGEFNRHYMTVDPDFMVCEQAMNDTTRFEERHGRKNMVIENDYMIKYKGTWTPEMVK